MKLSFFAFLISLGLTANAHNLAAPHFKKVVWLIFENETYDPVITQPDFARVAKAGALLVNFKAETHPSQGNYIAMVAGARLGVSGDGKYDLNDKHVGDLLEAAGLDWRTYAEDFPGKCFTGGSSGKYVRKHNPFMSFTNVTTNPARCAKIENTQRFFQDYANGSLPAFTMFIPNMNNDGHDTGYNFAGKWMTSQFGKIFADPAAMGDTLFIVTFDESSFTSPTNEVYTVLLGAQVVPGAQNNVKMNHVALLKMIEDEFKIGNLGREDVTAPVIDGIWKP